MDALTSDLLAFRTRWFALGRPRLSATLVAGSGLAVDLPWRSLLREPLAQWLPFPAPSVPGHSHELELLELPSGHYLLYFRGRLHGYQGLTPAQVVFPIRWTWLLGSSLLWVTNAAGGLNTAWAAGTLVLIRDHLNLTGSNPLTGDLPADWGPRFPDLSSAYDPTLRAVAKRHARALGFELPEGVYAGVSGPSYETPAEVQMLRILGADLVGMSTVHEVIAARHLGMRCLAVSLVSNPAAGLHAGSLSHEEVLEAGQKAAARLREVLLRTFEDPELFSFLYEDETKTPEAPKHSGS